MRNVVKTARHEECEDEECVYAMLLRVGDPKPEHKALRRLPVLTRIRLPRTTPLPHPVLRRVSILFYSILAGARASQGGRIPKTSQESLHDAKYW